MTYFGMNGYSVTAGNIGRVHDGDDKEEAESVYRYYVALSKSGVGSAAGEEVILWHDGEPIRHYCQLESDSEGDWSAEEILRSEA